MISVRQRMGCTLATLILAVAWSGDCRADDTDTPAHPAFAEQTPTIKPGHAAAPKADSPKVTATGALTFQIPISVPPARANVEPQLSLQYSSASYSEVTAFGTGWTFPISSVSRSIKHGTPRIQRNGTLYFYNDNDGKYPAFERDGVELAKDSDGANGAVVYRDRLDRTLTRSIYHPGADGYWEVTERNGNVSYYGNLPDHSQARAVLEDDLGIRQWLLLRTVDPFGNYIDYSYEQGPPRSDLSQFQLAPLPHQIEFGGNLKTGLVHTARVTFEYVQQPANFLLDHAKGHIFLDRLISKIHISLISPQQIEIRKYEFTIQPSPSTGRPLLAKVQETAGTLSAPPLTFDYSRNDGSPSVMCVSCPTSLVGFEPSAELSKRQDRSVFRLFGAASAGPLQTAPAWANLFLPNTDGDGHQRWPMEFLTGLTPAGHFASPAGIASGFQFLDLDGDGTTDILYHPNFLSGFGLAQPWMSFLQAQSGEFPSSLFSAYAGKADPLGAMNGATEYADVDQDGVVDRILLMPGTTLDDNGQLNNPAYAGICAWWFQHAGGYTDPVPDEMPIAVAAFLVHQAAQQIGVRGNEWESVMSDSMQTLLRQSGNQPIDGGIPSGFANCYRWGAQNTLGDPWLSGWLSGKPGGQVLPAFTIEHGRLNSPDETPKTVTSDLKHWPNIDPPSFHFKSNHPTAEGQIVISGAEDIRDVDTTVTDLDGDGVADLVILKSKTGSSSPDPNEQWGAGVWRLRDLTATHEMDETDTSTRFTSSLDALVLAKHQITGISIGDAIEDEQCAQRRPIPTHLVGLGAALQAQTLAQLRELRLPVTQSSLVKKYIDQLLSTRLSLGKWVRNGATLSVPGQRFLKGADWISTILDANGDGLPDLVLSRGATCIDASAPYINGLVQMDHKPGFDVYLNRGDRFEPSPSPSFAGGPFEMVRNWSKSGGNIGVLLDKDRFPFDALAFRDIDGDGILDATLSALIVSTAEPGWAFDSAACTQGQPVSLDPYAISTDPADAKILVNCAWRGTGTGWVPDLPLAKRLPSDGGINGAVLFWRAGGGICGPLHVPCNSFADAQSRTDLRRYADFDNDGMADLINVRDVRETKLGTIVVPELDSTRIYRNTGRRPDLLQAVDNGTGARTSILYRPASRDEMTRAPIIPWVVNQIVRNPQIDGSDQVALDTTNYSYSGGLYDYAEREFLGFKTVRETRPRPDASLSGGSVAPALLIERQFLQHDDGDASSCGIANARAGLQFAESRLSVPDASIESSQSQQSYEVHGICDRGRASIRRTQVDSLICKGSGCLTAGGAHISRRREFSNFDDFDNAQSETDTATRAGYLDGFDGTVSTSIESEFLNKQDEWTLGLPQIYKRSELSLTGSSVLADESYEYLHGKLAVRNVRRLNLGSSCPTVPFFREAATYDTEGNISEITNNDDSIIGSISPRKTFTYDPETHTYIASITDHYLREGQPAKLVSTYIFDRRFGDVQSITDSNGNTIAEYRDDLGRPTSEVGPDGQKTHQYSYDFSARPISITSIDLPGHQQPQVTTTEFYDGFGRLRQSNVNGPSSFFVGRWQIFDSTGSASQMALPFETSTNGFIPKSAFSGAAINDLHDVLGRTVTSTLADGRTKRLLFEPEGMTEIDFRGTPTVTYKDALGHTVAIQQSFRPANSTAAFDDLRTIFGLDADGRIVASRDADGNLRTFLYDERGDVVATETPHRANQSAGTYSFCFDGLGKLIRATTPGGVTTVTQLDALGRVQSQNYLPSDRFSDSDESFEYDDPSKANGLGHLTKSQNAFATIEFEYDKQGNISKRTVTTSLGSGAAPFKDGTFSYSAEFDALNRIVAETLPWDPAQIAASSSLQYTYDPRGNPSRVSAGPSILADIAPYTPANRPQLVDLKNGLHEMWSYDPLNNRQTASLVQKGAGPPLTSYSLNYDDDDNPVTISRFVGTGVGVTNTLKKTFAFDTLNRLESATFSGLTNVSRQFTYSYSPSGNIRTKDGFSYGYDGIDPQAVTTRTSPGQPSEHYSYDTDGELFAAMPGHDGRHWTYGWNGAGRLSSAAQGTGVGATTSIFRYGPDGARSAVIHRALGSSAADLFIGALELRSEGGASPRHGYYNVSFGPVHLQLALDTPGTDPLVLDLDATRFYHLDYLGSTALVSAADGTIGSISGASGRLDYAPYGEGLFADSGVQRIHARYTGKELDDPTGLTYFGARFADATLGRWISRDPAGITSPLEVDPTMFAFAGNNPVANVDSHGLQFQNPICVGLSCSGGRDIQVGEEIIKPAGKALAETGVVAALLSNPYTGIPTAIVLGILGTESAANAPKRESSPTEARVSNLRAAFDVALVAAGAKLGKGSGTAAEGGVLNSANYAQRTFGSTFSSGGRFAGQTVDEVAAALRSGAMKPADVPIQYIVRDGNALILNTRSAQALEGAGIPRARWNAINMTGDAAAEARLTGQLQRNGLTSQGTPTVTQGR